MVADVAQVGSPKQRVADGMNEHVGIAMAQQPQLMLYLDATQPKVATFHQPMDVVAHADSEPTPNPSRGEGGLISFVLLQCIRNLL